MTSDEMQVDPPPTPAEIAAMPGSGAPDALAALEAAVAEQLERQVAR